MIKKKTVLILGAGASAHFDYPVGSQLVDQICHRILNQRYGQIKEGFTDAAFSDFYMQVSRTMPASIDAFLEQNPLLIKIGKRLIVDCLKQYELPNRLFPPNDPGWYKTLIHAIDAPHVDELVKQPLTIITFNYDRSLDCFLHQWIQHRYKLDTDNAAQTLNELGIIHVHGTLGKYPFVPYSTEYTTTIDAMCDDIKIVHELAGDDTTFANQQFLDGHHKLQQAERIYFLGFGFHPDNIRRFKFFNTTNTASIEMVATNQMGEPNEKFMERMAGYGMEKMRRPHCNCHTFFLPQHATLD